MVLNKNIRECNFLPPPLPPNLTDRILEEKKIKSIQEESSEIKFRFCDNH